MRTREALMIAAGLIVAAVILGAFNRYTMTPFGLDKTLQLAIGLSVGSAVAVFFGWAVVGQLVRCVERRIAKPLRVEKGKEIWSDGPNAEVWELAMRRGEGGPYLGSVEALIFFLAIWVEGWILLASWLAFKVASKWQSWSQLAYLPKPPASFDDQGMIEYALLRHTWTARRYVTFLVGTGGNILVGAFGVGLGKLCVQYS